MNIVYFRNTYVCYIGLPLFSFPRNQSTFYQPISISALCKPVFCKAYFESMYFPGKRDKRISGGEKVVFGRLSADVDPKLGGKHASKSSSGLFTTSSLAKMATEEVTAMGSADLLMDDKWLSSILGEEGEHSDGDKKGVKRNKRQRKEKKIFDPSAIDEVRQAKRRRTRKDKDAFLLHQSPYLIRRCFVNVERICPTDDNIPDEEVKTEGAENVSAEEWENIERKKLFALSKEQREVLETVSSIKKEDSTLLPCPKCHRMFFSVNNLKLHIDSGHENFTVKVSYSCS